MRPACASRRVRNKTAARKNNQTNNLNKPKNLSSQNKPKLAQNNNINRQTIHSASCRSSRCNNSSKRGSLLNSNLPRKAKISSSTANLARDHLKSKDSKKRRTNSLEEELKNLRKQRQNLAKNKTFQSLDKEENVCDHDCKHHDLDSESSDDCIKPEIKTNSMKPNVDFNLERPDPGKRRDSILYQDNPETDKLIQANFHFKFVYWIFSIFSRIKTTRVTK